jgi:three-Cys-motif partner protein
MTHRFGGLWTDLKLQAVERYFSPYAQVMKRQQFKKIFVDAFAGTGERQQAAGKSDVITDGGLFGFELPSPPEVAKKGSVDIALQIKPPFDTYIFIEKRKRHAKLLKEYCAKFPDRDIRIVCMDANEALTTLCEQMSWKRYRAAVFLDPYGMQVDWQTLYTISQTRAMDVAILFPTGPINRVLTRSGDIPRSWQDRLDRCLGCSDWRDQFYYVQEQAGMFGSVHTLNKGASADQILKFAIARLKTIFPWVSDKALTLTNSKNTVQYHLLFACANPSPAAGKIFLRVAADAVNVQRLV